MKRVVSLALSILMILMVAGCSGGGGTDEGETQSQVSTSNQVAADQSSEADVSETEEDQGEPVEIKFMGYSFGNVPTDLQKVLDQFNEEYAIPLTNTSLSMEIINMDSWAQTLNVMLSSGEEFDAFPSLFVTPSQLYSVGQIQSIQSSMEKYGQDLMEIIPADAMEAMTVNGEIIGIANTDRSYGNALGLYYRKDLCEKYGFDESKLNDISYLEECLTTIKENEPSIQYTIVGERYGEYFTELIPDEHYTVPDANLMGIGTVLEEEEEYKVHNYFATDKFMQVCQLMRDWYNKGLLNSNASITPSDELQSYFKNGVAFGYLSLYYPETFTTLETTYPGLDVGAIMLSPSYTATGDYQVWSLCVPTASEKADNVVKLWNMLYSNIDACNMLCYGLEDVHYVMTGTDDREIAYPEGVDASNSPYVMSSTAIYGQVFDGYYFEGTPANMGEITDEFLKEIPASKLLGFYFDSTPINTEFAAVSAVIDEYYTNLINGAVEPSEYIPRFLDALDQAGVNECMAEFQSQLDAWAESK